MPYNPRGVPNIRPGLRYASTPVGTEGPGQAANINYYKTTGLPGPYGQPVPVGTEGPNQAAAIGRYMQANRNRETASKYGGRFDQRGVFGRQARGAGRGSGRSLPTGGAGGFNLFDQRPVEDPRIRRMTNKAVNAAFINADPRNAQKQFMGRGLSLDEGTLAAAIPRMSQAYGDAAYSSMVQPLFDYLADQTHNLQQQRLQVQKLSPLLGLLG
jgi:hypothetical protein